MRLAVCPGSFDPVTYGHLDIVTRACELFDRVIVAVLANPAKHPLFPAEERVAMLREATAHLGDRVECAAFDGLVVDFARKHGAVAIVRGLRAVSDFEYEFVMASMNRQLDERIDTVFMMTSREYAFVSSSLVKEVAALGRGVQRWVPPTVARRLAERLRPPRVPQDGENPS